ncbi:MAG: amidohydrolase [Clostridia bacterium]|nr:amidohydrolase [Clostridia bacterium]
MINITDYVEKNKELILSAEKYIWENPETGYKEWKTDKYLSQKFEELGYKITKAGDIPGFCTTIDTGKKGPALLILAELDSVICQTHPECNKETGAVHACGHNVQCANILGVAAALKEEDILKGLCGKIKLCFVPAEEGIEIGYRQQLIKKGIIKYASGKSEFMSRGFFDDVDLAFMVHIMSDETSDKSFSIHSGANGVIRKNIVFNGTASHAGGSPHLGVNALYAANLFLNAVNALRETFREQDYIRVHPIITKGGNMVNAIPDQVILESYVRGASIDAIKIVNDKVNRAAKCCAEALGASADITDIAGSAPLKNSENFSQIAVDIAGEIFGDGKVQKTNIWQSSSTDMGDLSAVMPVIHPYIGGAVGKLHGNDFYVIDKETACIKSAVFQLQLATKLLSNNGELAEKIIKNTKIEYDSFEEFLDNAQPSKN